jgi:hypothetical protein
VTPASIAHKIARVWDSVEAKAKLLDPVEELQSGIARKLGRFKPNAAM